MTLWRGEPWQEHPGAQNQVKQSPKVGMSLCSKSSKKAEWVGGRGGRVIGNNNLEKYAIVRSRKFSKARAKSLDFLQDVIKALARVEL